MIRRHTITVQNYTASTGGIGQPKYNVFDGYEIEVPCNVHPLTAELITTYGLQEVDARLVVADSWPGNTHSTITYAGATWDQQGPAKVNGISDGARSVQFIIKKRG